MKKLVLLMISSILLFALFYACADNEVSDISVVPEYSDNTSFAESISDSSVYSDESAVTNESSVPIQTINDEIESVMNNEYEFAKREKLFSLPTGHNENEIGYFNQAKDTVTAPNDFIALPDGGFAILDSQKWRIVVCDINGAITDIIPFGNPNDDVPILFAKQGESYCIVVEHYDYYEPGYDVIYLNGEKSEIITLSPKCVIKQNDIRDDLLVGVEYLDNKDTPVLITNRSKYISLKGEGELITDNAFDLSGSKMRFAAIDGSEISFVIPPKKVSFVKLAEWKENSNGVFYVWYEDELLIAEYSEAGLVNYAVIDEKWGDYLPQAGIEADSNGNIYQMVCNENEITIYKITMSEYE